MILADAQVGLRIVLTNSRTLAAKEGAIAIVRSIGETGKIFLDWDDNPYRNEQANGWYWADIFETMELYPRDYQLEDIII